MQRRVDAVVDECRAQTAAAMLAAEEAKAEASAARNRDGVMKALRDALTILVGTWRRQCGICGELGMCPHREPELIERWQQGHLS